MRRKVRRDLRRRGLPQEKALAAVVRLLERSLVRVGNEEYARDNRSFGLTTLRDRHVRLSKHGHIELRFRGKGNVSHRVRVRAPRIARVIRTCRNRPSRDLFKFEDGQGVVRDITAQHVNAHLGRREGIGAGAVHGRPEKRSRYSVRSCISEWPDSSAQCAQQ